MARFEIPDAGTVLVFRNGWSDPEMPERHRKVRWRFTVTDTGGRVLLKGDDIETPRHAGPDTAAIAAIAFMLHAHENEDGDTPDALSAWSTHDFESSDNDRGRPDSINVFRTDSTVTHWRPERYSESGPDGDTWDTLTTAKADMLDRYLAGRVDPGTVWDLYPNDGEKPTHRLTLTPRIRARVDKIT